MKVIQAIMIVPSPERRLEPYRDFTHYQTNVVYVEDDDTYHHLLIDDRGNEGIGDPIMAPILLRNGNIIFPNVEINDYDICSEVLKYIELIHLDIPF